VTQSIRDGLHVQVRDGGGASILWIHGYTMDSSVWENVWEQLPGYRHVGLDLPGHGNSRAIDRADTMTSLGELIGTIAAEENTRHLVSLSFGTLFGLQVAATQPRLFDTATFAAPAFGGGPSDEDVADRYDAMRQLRRNGGADPELIDLWMSDPPNIFAGTRTRLELRCALRRVIERHEWAELADGLLFDLARFPQAALDWRGIDARTLLIVGEHDLAATEQAARQLEARIPRAEPVKLAGTGHLTLLEEPARGAELLKSFWLTRAAS